MKPANHIRRLFRECYRIQEHGHCDDAADMVRIKDVETAVQNLGDNFESKEMMKIERRKRTWTKLKERLFSRR